MTKPLSLSSSDTKRDIAQSDDCRQSRGISVERLVLGRRRMFLSPIYIVLLACVSDTHQIEKSSSELFRVRRASDSKWGYIDKTGKVIIEPQFDSARDFSEGLAWAGKGGKYFFINGVGKIVIDSHEKLGNPTYDFVGDFTKGGIARVKVNDDFGNDVGYIDKMGRLVIRMKVEPNGNVTAIYPVNSASRSLSSDVSMEESLLSLKVNNKYGYYDINGREIIRPQFDIAYRFSEGLARVELGGKYGYIDKTGQIIIPPQFDYAENFSEGLAVVGIDDKYGYIDKKGKIVITLQYKWGLQFVEGLAPVHIKRGEKAGYINQSGAMVITPKFDLVGSFSEDLAPVSVNNLWGYIDKAGKIVIEPRFDYASSFSKGIARIEIDNKFGYIDKAGSYIWKPGS